MIQIMYLFIQQTCSKLLHVRFSTRRCICSKKTILLLLLLSHFSRVWLFATPWTVAYQAPLSMGFFQARVLEWVAISFSMKTTLHARNSQTCGWQRSKQAITKRWCHTAGKWQCQEYAWVVCLGYSTDMTLSELQVTTSSHLQLYQ